MKNKEILSIIKELLKSSKVENFEIKRPACYTGEKNEFPTYEADERYTIILHLKNNENTTETKKINTLERSVYYWIALIKDDTIRKQLIENVEDGSILRESISGAIDSFVWKDTPQGGGYWMDIHKKAKFGKLELIIDNECEELVEAKCTTKATTCPVCQGRGKVPNGFYRTEGHYGLTSDCSPEECKSCNVAGYIIVN